MADTADRRSEKDLSEKPKDKKARKEYKTKKSSGLCVYSGCVSEVKGRAYCYHHSSYQSKATYKSGTRYFLRMAGIDPENDTSSTIPKWKIALLLDLLK